MNSRNFKDSPFGKCCSYGKVDLPPLQSLFSLLAELVLSEGPTSKKFLSHIRAYNLALQLAFASANMSRD